MKCQKIPANKSAILVHYYFPSDYYGNNEFIPLIFNDKNGNEYRTNSIIKWGSDYDYEELLEATKQEDFVMPLLIDVLNKYKGVILLDIEIKEDGYTNEIMDRAVDYDFEHTPMIPQLPLDKIPPFEIEHRYKDYYEKYPEFGYYAHTENIQDKYFFYKIEQSLYELIEINCKDLEKYIARLNDEFHELRLISEAFIDSMASYYTTMAKIIDLIWNTDSLSMPAR